MTYNWRVQWRYLTRMPLQNSIGVIINTGMALLWLISGTGQNELIADNGLMLSCRNGTFPFTPIRSSCGACGDGHDHENPVCAGGGTRICTCDACECPAVKDFFQTDTDGNR